MHPGRSRFAREPISPRHGESQKVVKLRDALCTGRPSAQNKAFLQSPNGEKTEIPPSIFDVLVRVADDMARGHAVVIVPIEHELTTQEAAELLSVSRPYLIKLLEQGEIDFHMVGTHRRIRFKDLMEFREQRDRARREALDALARESREDGLQY